MSELDKPATDSDATMFIPTPGRKNVQKLQMSTLSNLDAVGGIPVDHDNIGGLNPVVASANIILTAVPRIRSQINHPNPKQLRETMVERINKFEQLSKNRGISTENITIARYALCTLVDEAVSSTPWGANADWANRSLLVTFHQEGWGGEKFFQILNKLAENPTQNIDLIELFYVCLTLGLEGRFRIADNGRSQLDNLREKVAKLIYNTRGDFERDLSKNWQGENAPIAQNKSYLSLWVALTGTSLLLLSLFLFLNFNLNESLDKIEFRKLSATPPKTIVVAEKPSPRLSKFLEQEIREGLVQILDESNKSTVSILGDGLFDSGSATIKLKYEHVLERVAAGLNAVSGQVLVLGHTDNKPSRSMRFPSNWHLSKARAENVANTISKTLTDSARLHLEGRGDTEPVAPNDTEINRAKNRRIEIILQVAG